MILNRLCDASGNSEPGDTEPTRTLARQRSTTSHRLPQGRSIAVIADGHGNATHLVVAVHDQRLAVDRGVASAATATNWSGLGPDLGRDRLHRYRDRHDRVLPIARYAAGHDQCRCTCGRGHEDRVYAGAMPAASDIASSKFRADIEWLYASGLVTGSHRPSSAPMASSPGARWPRSSPEPPVAVLDKDYFRDDDNVTTRPTSTGSPRRADLAAGLSVLPVRRRHSWSDGLVPRPCAGLPASSDYFSDDGNVSHEANIDRIAKAGLTSGCGGGASARPASYPAANGGLPPSSLRG